VVKCESSGTCERLPRVAHQRHGLAHLVCGQEAEDVEDDLWRQTRIELGIDVVLALASARSSLGRSGQPSSSLNEFLS
jgi:hypothetical protein